MKDGETENDRQRDGNAQSHFPEDAFFGVERRTPVAIQPGQPEYARAGKPTNEE